MAPAPSCTTTAPSTARYPPPTPGARHDDDAGPLAPEPDVARFGEYRITQTPDDPRPIQRFAGRLVAADADGDGTFAARPDRFHLYAGWFCPWAQRATLVISLSHLDDVVPVSYVAPGRDARGWGFRGATGPDPVNGFTFLRDAYEATEPGFDGHVSVPTLWDRETGRIASNDYTTLDRDLAGAFRKWSDGPDLYPEDLRDEVDELEAWLLPAVNRGAHRAAQDLAARAELQTALTSLDHRLENAPYLLGDRLTVADLRLWVTLVRWDVGPNASGEAGPRLPELPAIWAWARGLYARPEVRATTDLAAFSAPGATQLDWETA